MFHDFIGVRQLDSVVAGDPLATAGVDVPVGDPLTVVANGGISSRAAVSAVFGDISSLTAANVFSGISLLVAATVFGCISSLVVAAVCDSNSSLGILLRAAAAVVCDDSSLVAAAVCGNFCPVASTYSMGNDADRSISAYLITSTFSGNNPQARKALIALSGRADS